MKIEQRDNMPAAGGQQPNFHSFEPGPPGAGPLHVCTACGEKETSLTARAECIGRPAVGGIDTISEYDPYG